MTTDLRTYQVHATSSAGGTAHADVKSSTIRFDATPAQGETLPGPADLLATAFAACVLKNVERFSHILPFRYQHADIDVTARRQDSPARILSIRYSLRIVTDEPTQRLELLHTNIRRHGTIYNTLAAACDIHGDITALAPPTGVAPNGPAANGGQPKPQIFAGGTPPAAADGTDGTAADSRTELQRELQLRPGGDEQLRRRRSGKRG